MVKIGVTLAPNPLAPASEVIEQAQAAERQGFDSVWISDHLVHYWDQSEPTPHAPYEAVTLMTAIGASTSRVRLGWATLNPGFRHPAVLAKALATLDVITSGRVICTLGAGWVQDDFESYGLRYMEKDDRVAQVREIAELFKELWANPAPHRVTYEGRYVTTKNLAFNPAPVQRPSIPIWIGGDSPGMRDIVRDIADGWMTRTTPDDMQQTLESPGWGSRPLTVMRVMPIVVRPTRAEALEDSRSVYEGMLRSPFGAGLGSFEDFVGSHVIGDPQECLSQIQALEAIGVNYLLVRFNTPKSQEAAGSLLLPLLQQTVPSSNVNAP